MFENLGERLERSFKILKGEGKITEINVAETLKDVRKALLDADVNYKIAKSFTETVKASLLLSTLAKNSQSLMANLHLCMRIPIKKNPKKNPMSKRIMKMNPKRNTRITNSNRIAEPKSI